MSKLRLITDTNASLPAELIEKFQIVEVPIHIQFGEDSFKTGVEIDDQKLFEMIDARNELPKTAAPSPGDFSEAYQRVMDEGADQVICICCSSTVSATFNAAQMAAEMHPDWDITVVDSKQLSLAEGFQVLAAAEAVQRGVGKQEIVALVEDLQKRMHVFGALPTLKYLAMGGRMGRLAAGLGETLAIKPILQSNEGKLELLEKVRTWKKARQRLIELAAESTAGKKVEQVGMIHVNNLEGVQSLFESLKEELGFDLDPVYTDFTPGLSVHTGSGVIAYVLVTEA